MLRRPAFAALAAVLTALPLAVTGVASAQPDRQAGRHGAPSAEPLVIAHRGASGYRPEHTLAAYELAVRMGADYIEPDLVSTRDGVLVARHENEISGTTDVAERPEFADRRTTKTIDGVPLTGWFTEDFTLDELRTLRAVERLPEVRQENTVYDGLYEVPTFAEVLDLRARLSRELKREIGVYPETKHPTYFDEIGLSLEEPLVRELDRAGLNRPKAPVFVQSFETTNLKEMDAAGVRVALVQLISSSGAPYDLAAAGDETTYADMATAEGLKQISEYADGVGPEKSLVIPRNVDGSLGEPTDLVDDAHEAGIVVHPWTFRNENVFLPRDYWVGVDPTAYGRAIAEQRAYLETGIDGFFTDNPDTGVESVRLFLQEGDAA
ncbi:MAG: glycerophosphodiester phosphodiesterase [Actinomycetes bacterium]